MRRSTDQHVETRLAFLLLCLAFFFFSFGNSAFHLLPKHFELSNFAPRTIGFIMGAAPIGGLIILPVLMATIDHYRLHLLTAIAILLQMIVTALYLVPISPNGLYAAPRFLQGCITTATLVSFNAVVSRGAIGEQRLRRFTLFGMMGPLGSLSSVGVGEPIYDAHGLAALYFVAVSAFVLAFATVVLIGRRFLGDGWIRSNGSAVEGPAANTIEKAPLLTHLFRDTVPYTIGFLILVLGVSMGTMVTFVPSAVLAEGLPQIRPFFIAYPIAIIVTRVAMTGVLKRVPHQLLIVPPLIGLPVTLFMIPIVDSPAGLATVGAVYGMSHGILSPILVSTFLSRGRQDNQGRMSTVFQFLFNIGTFGAANVGGLLAEIHIQWTFWGAGSLALIAAVFGLFRVPRTGLKQT